MASTRSFGLAVLALGLSLALLGACATDPETTAEAEPIAVEPVEEGILVRVEPVRAEPMSALYSTSATLRAYQRATVTARTRGVVRRLVVEEGARVAAGQALAHLEDDEQKIAAERDHATLETRQWEFERAEKLYLQTLVSEEAFETARREKRDAEQAAALAELELSRTVVRAPFRGVVLRRHLDVGNSVSDGTPVYDLADVDRLLADVNVPERHVGRLEARQAVRLTVDATSEMVEAVIERIAPAVDVETGTVRVTLTLAGTEILRPGSFVRVDIVTDTHPEALVVPRSALMAEGRRWMLYAVDDDGARVRQVQVSLGFEDGDRVEVLGADGAAALAPGRRVVVAGVGALSDGAAIEIDPGSGPGGSSESGDVAP
ncbi:MAG: efflux RND transporter periplasmic adaptor subunit [bacterium]|nr:efflux RND transporter periplasmic adaptor subunit [bacterium]